MEFSREGLEEFFSDGVLNPATTSEPYLKNCTKYKELGSRVFVLYEPDSTAFPNGADFDVVLLHGIGSDEFKCWTNAQGIVWPAVFFPQDFPMARVLTVGYAHSLFKWKADANGTAETATKPLPLMTSLQQTSVSSGTLPETTKPQTEKDGALQPDKLLAESVGQTAKDSVSTYAPKEVAQWWTKASAALHDREGEKGDQLTPQATSSPSDSKEENTREEESALTAKEGKQNPHTSNPLFRLLTSIRDPTGLLVAAEAERSAGNLSSFTPEADGATNKEKKPTRDIQSLQNMRVVAAELAERLGSPEVGVGQRPVVFLVHSMGGLILKQMLIALFEATRLAPPPTSTPTLAAASSTKDCTEQEAVIRQNSAAVQTANVLLRAVRGIVFYGTPHFGSAVASVITGLRKYYQGLGGLTPTGVVTGLGDHNKLELMRLNDRFFDVIERLGEDISVETAGSAWTGSQSSTTVKNYIAAMESSLVVEVSTWDVPSNSPTSFAEGSNGSNGARGTVRILSFGETKKLNGLVRVVDPESANPAPDDPRYPFYLVNADHREICRPLTKMSPSYSMVYGLLDRLQQRGLLRRQPEQVLPEFLLGATSVCTSPGSSDEARASSAIEKMSESYESGWSALFDSAKLPSTTSAGKEKDPTQPPVGPSSAHARLHTGNRRCLLHFQQGLGETRLALPMLEEALADLRQLLHRFFGIAVPPQLDSIFLLAADMTDFVAGFYQHEARVVQTLESDVTKTNAKIVTSSGSAQDGRTLVDAVVSFRVPLQILTYWAQQAADLLRVVGLSHQERAIGIGAASGAPPAAANWESKLSLHAGGRDLRELAELEQSVEVVREEWEAFRRYVSLRLRAISRANAGSTQRGERGKRAKSQENALNRSGETVGPSAREHIAALFFARAIRTIISQHLHDGGALGGLLGAYLRSAILQIRGSEKQLSPVRLEHDPWASIEDSGATDAASVVSLVMEGLELSISHSPAPEDSNVLMDTNGSGVELAADAELHAIVPALTATSSVLLGCVALFVDRMHRLDGNERWPRAAQHFQLATSSLKADFQVRRRLLRAASRTMQSEGFVLESRQDGGRSSRGAEKDWWKTVWETTTTKAEVKNSAGGSAANVVAAIFPVGRQGHVAKLDDGLFLSAMQLAVGSFECSLLIRACQARQALGVGKGSTSSTKGGEHMYEEKKALGQSTGPAKESNANTYDPLDDFVRSVEAVQKVYLRTNQILRGLFALSDIEKPFALAGNDPDRRDTEKRKGLPNRPEKSMKDQLRAAIQGILSELDAEEEEDESYTSTALPPSKKDALKDKADEVRQSLSWTSRASVVKRQNKHSNKLATRVNKSTEVESSVSMAAASEKNRKNSLPTFVMNSLSKAWETVRSGSTPVETPEHFAYTAMVMWWMVEWEAAAVIKNGITESLHAEANCTPASTTRAKLHALLDTIEATQQKRREATTSGGKPAAGTSASSSTTSELSPTPRVKEEEKWASQCWSHADEAIRCKWMTLSGGEELLRNLNTELRAEHETLHKILSSTSVNQLREIQDTFAPSAALMHLDGEGGTRLGIPSLLDAVQHDDTSAALRCWLGHCYALHRMGSPDTAHAYLQAIRSGYAARKAYTSTAEVGLAWSHLHNVPCSFSQPWRAMPKTILSAADVSSTGVSEESIRDRRNSMNARAVVSLLDFRLTGVIDTSALHSVPSPLVQFCHDAVLHHTDAVQKYQKSRSASQLRPDSDARLHSLALMRPSAHTGSLRHLRFAEEGFQRALRTDPTNIGALCGLGRLRCLSVNPSLSNGSVHKDLTSGITLSSFLSPYSHDAVRVSSTEAVGFFSAALSTAAHKRPLLGLDATARRASPESCAHVMDNVWLSYAAYWMSEEARRVHVTPTAPTESLSNSSSSNRNVASGSTEWLLRSLRYYPRNDWALTSLGLSYLQDASAQTLKPHVAEKSVAATASSLTKEDELEVLQWRGLTLLQRALTINATNMWALWGVCAYGVSTPHRTTCQRLLRSLILRSIPRW